MSERTGEAFVTSTIDMTNEELGWHALDRVTLEAIRQWVDGRVRQHPDDSHGEGYLNHAYEGVRDHLDILLDAPCRPFDYTTHRWCLLHHAGYHGPTPDRCDGYGRAP